MDNTGSETGIEILYKDKPFITNLIRVLTKHPEARIIDALSKGQLLSKQWLVTELGKITVNPGLTFILGGWYGTLAAIMLESNIFENIKIRSFDIDPSCADIADTMNRFPWVVEGWQFKASTADMYQLDYNQTKYITYRIDGSTVDMQESPDTIINTSCEHLEYFQHWWNKIPQGKLAVLQSNDFFDEESHVNCVNNLEEFIEATRFSKILYSGELELQKYNRFMIIGEK